VYFVADGFISYCWLVAQVAISLFRGFVFSGFRGRGWLSEARGLGIFINK
jgi:hypothetical protein